MNVYIFSYPINNFKILLKSSHNIESALFFFNCSVTQVTSQPYSIHLISPAFRTSFKRPLQNKKVTWRCEHNPNNQFFYLTKRKKMSMLWTSETTETTILNNWNNHLKQLRQPFYSLIHSKTIETCYKDTTQKTIETCYKDTTQTTVFWILAETFYIQFTFYNFNQFIGWIWNF